MTKIKEVLGDLNKLKGGRTIRMKARQSIFIEGHPEFLFDEKPRSMYYLVHKGKQHGIGAAGDELANALIELVKGYNTTLIDKNNNSQILKEETKVKRTKTIKQFPGLQIRKQGENTVIVASDINESELMKKVASLKDFLENQGVIVKERCNWMCITDQAKKQIPNEEIIRLEKQLQMSDHTKSLRDIALRSLNPKEGEPLKDVVLNALKPKEGEKS